MARLGDDIFCTHCGRQLIETRKSNGFDSSTGKPSFSVTIECPGYYEKTGFLNLFRKCGGRYIVIFGYPIKRT